ncbi:amino acid ABC transporter substrate-binding protein [Desulfosarcina alkanivorans]|uniref:Amino acid ABC transporter substrate-binding protein n=1 Tax=Desulfosarcina alkanivorans TaxID=571177 RepID=A0A5K7YMQ6_9BACT|nr:transporter substrate-binding domain-containing protein [Desulfosarcina alkanivorans]BBO70486.1 amino acid ABC transporter substrate-binding protein [Desulfosarcina alkanivorans]
MRILALFFLILLRVGLPATWAHDIVLVADPWPPFNMEPGGDREGYLIDVARAVFEPAGYTVTYRTVPWKRAIEGVRTGRYTGAVGASNTDAAGFVFPDEELARNTLAFFTRGDHPWVFDGPASIETVSLGVAAGYDYRQWLNGYIAAHRNDEQRVQVIAGVQPLKQNLKKLLLERIDVVVDTEAAIRYTAKEMGIWEQIKFAGHGVEPAYIHIAFSPALAESPELAGLLSRGIVNLRRSGRLKEILDRYGLHDWK